MEITFERFIEIAKETNCLDILECWDKYDFEIYVKFFGPMSEKIAYDFCYITNAVSQDEMAAGEYFPYH